MMGTQVGPPPVITARQGTSVELRPARMDDEQRVREFLSGLSPASRTLRFFTGLARPTAALLRALVTVDDRRDILLAVDGAGVVIGHAMSYRRPDATEVAVVVTDQWQGIGIGTRLVRTLLRRAVARGAVYIGMDVMGENRKVLSIIRRWWPDAQVRVECGTVEVLAEIAPLFSPGHGPQATDEPVTRGPRGALD